MEALYFTGPQERNTHRWRFSYRVTARSTVAVVELCLMLRFSMSIFLPSRTSAELSTEAMYNTSAVTLDGISLNLTGADL